MKLFFKESLIAFYCEYKCIHDQEKIETWGIVRLDETTFSGTPGDGPDESRAWFEFLNFVLKDKMAFDWSDPDVDLEDISEQILANNSLDPYVFHSTATAPIPEPPPEKSPRKEREVWKDIVVPILGILGPVITFLAVLLALI